MIIKRTLCWHRVTDIHGREKLTILISLITMGWRNAIPFQVFYILSLTLRLLINLLL